MNEKFPVVFFLCLSLIFSSCHGGGQEKTNSGKDSLNIDPLQTSPDLFTLVMENGKVRVIRYSLKPGEKDNWHTHPPKSAYVISGGKLKVFLENGETIIADEIAGTASWSDYVGKHYVENIGNTVVTILLTEVK